MTHRAPSSKLVILEDRRGSDDVEIRPRMRRYRIARLRFDDLPAGPDRRFDYLKHTHD
jgi:hypothetical protein